MKILHVIECFSSKFGGPVTALRSLAHAQASEGHNVTLFTTNRDYPGGVTRKPGRETFFNGALTIHYFPTEFVPLKFSMRLARCLNREITRFDIVHIHGLYRFPPTYAAHCARKRGVPHVICPHGALDPYLHNRSTYSPILKRAYRSCFDLPNLRGASAIHFTAEEERERAEHLGLNASSFVLPHGVDESRYKNLPEKGHFRRLLGMNDAPLILFLGRQHFVKGLDLLIPAFNRLRQSHPQAHLAIVGPDSNGYGQKLREWAHQRGFDNNVHFMGYLEETEVRESLTDADTLVLPSYTESFGMTVIEAMACATPAVVSNQVHIHREVERNGAGLVTDGTIDGITSALERLLRNPEMARDMGENGRRVVLEQYTWGAVIEKLIGEYRTVISQASRRAQASRVVDGSRT